MGKFILYCRNGCIYSENAKKLIIQYTDNHLIHQIEDKVEDKKIIINKLKEYIGSHNTFPIIFYKHTNNNIKFIGGYSELNSLISTLS